jgi:hypothetical protein
LPVKLIFHIFRKNLTAQISVVNLQFFKGGQTARAIFPPFPLNFAELSFARSPIERPLFWIKRSLALHNSFLLSLMGSLHAAPGLGL